MRVGLLLGVLSLAVIGCVTRSYTHDQKTKHDFAKDELHCAALAGQACGLSDGCKSARRDQCLQIEGWSPKVDVRWPFSAGGE